MIAAVARALDASVGMGKEQLREVEPGITVRTVSFERLVQELAEDHQLYMLDKKGEFVRDAEIGEKPMLLANRPHSDAEEVVQQLEAPRY